MDNTINTAIYGLLIAFFANIVLCYCLIPVLYRFKFGQPIRSDGPQEHLKKAGTPTLGGLIIVSAIVLGSIFFMRGNDKGVVVLAVTLGCMIIGFLDDYFKLKRKNSGGLRAWQKMLGQIIVTGMLAFYIHSSGAVDTVIYVPFTGANLDLGFLFYPSLFVIMVGTMNGANFTDGLDGLASGVTILVATFFLFMALSLDTSMLPVLGAAIGSLLGFLLFNSHPARVFMGDTGSLALGGLIASVAIFMRLPLLIPIVAFIYFLEVISVMLQVAYFKLTHGKRLFRMAPIHHHFEKGGMSETKVVALFYIITAIACLVGFLASGGIY